MMQGGGVGESRDRLQDDALGGRERTPEAVAEANTDGAHRMQQDSRIMDVLTLEEGTEMPHPHP